MSAPVFGAKVSDLVVLVRGKTYRVVRTSLNGNTFHRAQGWGFPAIGDIVRIGNEAQAVFQRGDTWLCWAVESHDAYGAYFSADMLEWCPPS